MQLKMLIESQEIFFLDACQSFKLLSLAFRFDSENIVNEV